MFRARFITAVVVVAGVACATTASAGEVLDRIRARGYVTLVGEPAWPPFSSLEPDGTYVGFDVDVANEVARRLGVEPRRVDRALTWEEETGGHWGGRIDMSVGSMTPTAKRAENLVFPAIYTYAVASLAVNRDNTSIRKPADASGKRIGVLKGATYESYLRREAFGIAGAPQVDYKIDDPVIVTFEEESATLESLASGDGVEVDGVINYLPTLMEAIRSGMPLRIVGQPLYHVPQAVAIEPGDPEFATLLGEIVAEMHADGTLTSLSKKWFEFDLTAP